MNSIRSALIFTTAERYLGLLLNLVTLAIVSRLLTPTEVGIAAIGWAILSIPYALRDLGMMDVIIQRKELTEREIRTAATLCGLTSIAMVVLILVAAPAIGNAYGDARVGHFLSVMVFAALTDAVANPLVGLMRRDLAFNRVIVVNLGLSTVTCGVTIVLALLGFSYMSSAWGAVLGNATAAALAVYLRPTTTHLRPSLFNWREIAGAGLYFSSMAALMRAYEALPYLALGRFLQPADTGYFNRAMQTCQLPDKVLLAGITSIAFPTLAAEVREGRELKPAYLRAIELITVVQWPALILLALLASRVVEVLFGSQWQDAVPLIQVMALASMIGAVASLNYPMLYALGHPRIAFLSTMLSLPLSALIVIVAASNGRMALAMSLFLTIPFNNAIALHFIMRHIDMSWGELWGSMKKSVLVCLATLTGPLGLIVTNGLVLELPATTQLVLICLAGFGWFIGLKLTRHAILPEIILVIRAVRSRMERLSKPEVPAMRKIKSDGTLG